jgi:hypothetical protein
MNIKDLWIPIPQRTKFLQSLHQFEDLLITNHQQMTLVHHPSWKVNLSVPILRLNYPWMVGDGILELTENGISPVVMTDSTLESKSIDELNITCIDNFNDYAYIGTREGYLVSIHRSSRTVSDFSHLPGWISHIGVTSTGIFVALPELHVIFVPFSSGTKMDFENAIIIDSNVKQVQHLSVRGDSVLFCKPNRVVMATMVKRKLQSIFQWTIPLCLISGLVFGVEQVRVYSSDAQLYSMKIPNKEGTLRNPTEVKDDSMSFLQYNSNYGHLSSKVDEDEDGEEDENTDSKLRLFGVISSYHGLIDTYLIGDLSQEPWGTELRHRFCDKVDVWEQILMSTLRSSTWLSAGGSFVVDDILRVYISDSSSLSRLIEMLTNYAAQDLESIQQLRVLALINYCILQTKVLAI